MFLQLSDNDDDDDDDVNSTDVDDALESGYQLSSFLQHAPSGSVSRQISSDWRLGSNNYTTAVRTPGDCYSHN